MARVFGAGKLTRLVSATVAVGLAAATLATSLVIGPAPTAGIAGQTPCERGRHAQSLDAAAHHFNVSDVGCRQGRGAPTPTAAPSTTTPSPGSTPPNVSPDATQQATAAPVPPSTAPPVPSRTPTPKPKPPVAPPPPPPPPPPSGWPRASNTGVPAGTVLTAYSGPTNITTDGTVINGALVTNACFYIAANNVTIENTRITGLGCFAAIQSRGSGLVVKNTEIDGLNRESGGAGQETYGVFGGNWTCEQCNVHGLTEALTGCHNVTLLDSWVHDLFVSSTSHNEDLYCGGTSGGNLIVRHNVLSNQNNSVGTVTLFGDFSAVTNVTISDNLLNGGGFTLYGGHDPSKAYGLQDANIHIVNNRFMRSGQAGAYWPAGGHFGPVTAFDSSSAGNVWSGNVWDDTGAVVPPGG